MKMRAVLDLMDHYGFCETRLLSLAVNDGYFINDDSNLLYQLSESMSIIELRTWDKIKRDLRY